MTILIFVVFILIVAAIILSAIGIKESAVKYVGSGTLCAAIALILILIERFVR